MKILYRRIAILLGILFKNRQQLILENIALRHQLAILHRSIKRLKIKNTDRFFWIWLSKIWGNWKSALFVVKPETVVGWHRKGFKFYWKWKSRQVGRPQIDWKLIKLIRKLQKDNSHWSAQRIQGELTKLGFDVCDNTVAKYMRKPKAGPDQRQRWRTFLKNHALVLYAGNLIASQSVNSGYKKKIGTGAEISELWPDATANLNSSSNNVLIASGSKLESHGGTLIASSGSLLTW